MVLITMRVRAPSWERFRDALDWIAGLGEPDGMQTMRAYRRQDDPQEILWVCEMEDIESWARCAARLGPELKQRSNTDVEWTDEFWDLAEDAPTFPPPPYGR